MKNTKEQMQKKYETPLREDMERHVSAINKYIVSALPAMNFWELLSNCHPIYRGDYIERLRFQTFE